eukprot:Sdes_comp19247_c1_seq1m10198
MLAIHTNTPILPLPQRHPAPCTRLQNLGKLHNAPHSGRGHRNVPRMLPIQQGFRIVLQNGLENSHQRIAQLILQIIFRINRYVILHHINRILRLFIRSTPLGFLHNHIRNSIPHRGRRSSIPLPHPLSKLNMRLLPSISIPGTCQGFGDHQLGNINLVLQQITNRRFRILNSPRNIPINQNLLQYSRNQILHKRTIVPPNSLNPLTIHLVVLFGLRPIQPSIPLLINQQVREINLFKLQSYRIHKIRTHILGRLRPQLHRFPHRGYPKFHHHRISIPINHPRIKRIPILHRIPLLHERFRSINHLPPKSSHRRRNLQARKLPHSSTRKPIH